MILLFAAVFLTLASADTYEDVDMPKRGFACKCIGDSQKVWTGTIWLFGCPSGWKVCYGDICCRRG
uniref:Sodium channel toxin protein n=1 Tax=Anemonia sulcata TaxID=6108 RepID=A0A0S1M171_ANESU|nr:sodium channel toxin protein [Anemonia sulcata]